MSDGEDNGGRTDFRKIDQGGARCGVSEVEGKDDSGSSWPRAVDKF